MEEIAQMIRLEELAQLLLQWSNATNMAVMLVDDQGNEIIESTHQSSYCQLIHKYDHESCKKCWLNHQDGNFVCPAGFHNFSFSLYLPNGGFFGRVYVGQVLYEKQDNTPMKMYGKKLGIDFQTLAPALEKLVVKTKAEIDASYLLLTNALNAFINDNYKIWQMKQEVDEVKSQSTLALLKQERKINDDINSILEGAKTGIFELCFPTNRPPKLYANKMMDELLGTTKDLSPEERYLKWIEGIDPLYTNEFDDYLKRMQRDGKAEIDYVWHHPTKGKLFIRCGGILNPNYPDGMGIKGYHRDISNTKQQQEKQSQLVQEQYSVIDAISTIYLVVWLFDIKANTVQVIREINRLNSPAQDAKYNAQEAIINVLEQCVEKEDQEKMKEFYDLKRLAIELQNKDSVSIEFRDTLMGWCRMNAVAIREVSQETVNKIIIYVEQIDEEKRKEIQAQQLLNKAYQEAKRANSAKTEFLSRMSHDIRTPINGIVGMTNIAKKVIHDPVHTLDALNKISDASEQLKMLINDVLDMSRLESGKTELTKETFYLPKLLEKSEATLNVYAKEHHVQTIGEHYTVQHDYLIGSPLHLQRILINVISNAIKYNKKDGTIELWLEEKPIDQNHSWFIFTIKDTGIGIEKDYLPHLFEPFSREHLDAGTHYQGTGLGMAITKELVDLMQGTIEVESEVNVGTTFRITLPFELDLKKHDQQVKVSKNKRFIVENAHVLVVEDNEINLEIARFFLEEIGVVVVSAKNGKEALDLLITYPNGYFDLILMDIMMPVLNGLEATKVIRALNHPYYQTIPIIAMTANAFVEDVKACLDVGMNAHIAKPIDMTLLYQILENYLKDKIKNPQLK